MYHSPQHRLTSDPLSTPVAHQLRRWLSPSAQCGCAQRDCVHSPGAGLGYPSLSLGKLVQGLGDLPPPPRNFPRVSLGDCSGLKASSWVSLKFFTLILEFPLVCCQLMGDQFPAPRSLLFAPSRVLATQLGDIPTQ